MLSIGLIGCGLWGPNLARNFSTLGRCKLVACCDRDYDKAVSLCRRLDVPRAVEDYMEILRDPSIEAVVVATPLQTHYHIVKDALENGKHVFVEKPLTSDFTTSRELTEMAKEKNRVLMVGFVFLFNPAVRRAHQMVHAGEIGELYYMHTVRANLGPIRMDTDAAWDLASHDVSILLYCMEEKPVAVNAIGGRFIGNPFDDVCIIGLEFASRRKGYIYVSWLDPCKVRQVTFVGSKKMLLFDDMNMTEPLKLYDSGVIRDDPYDSYGAHRMAVRTGDILSPYVKMAEPLFTECEAFLQAILDGEPNIAVGDLPLQITAVLDAVKRSLGTDGQRMEILP